VKKKAFLKRARRFLKNEGKAFSKSPLVRAARGKHTKGFI